jgi:hypothetical protein
MNYTHGSKNYDTHPLITFSEGPWCFLTDTDMGAWCKTFYWVSVFRSIYHQSYVEQSRQLLLPLYFRIIAWFKFWVRIRVLQVFQHWNSTIFMEKWKSTICSKFFRDQEKILQNFQKSGLLIGRKSTYSNWETVVSRVFSWISRFRLTIL